MGEMPWSARSGAVQIDRLQEQLKRLKLVRTADQLAAKLGQICGCVEMWG